MSPSEALIEQILERVRGIVREEVQQASGPYWDEPIGVEEAAAFLKCPQSRLYAGGRIPAFKEGGRNLYTRRQLHEWLTSGEAGKP
jgi:hypothetical protein